MVDLGCSDQLAGCAPQERFTSERAPDRNPSDETMFKLPVAQRLAAAFLGSAGHSVARMPTKPPMVVKAAMTAEMSRLQPILKGSAEASPAARGHSTVPAVMKTPAAAAKPSRPAMSNPHLISFSFRDLACWAMDAMVCAGIVHLRACVQMKLARSHRLDVVVNLILIWKDALELAPKF